MLVELWAHTVINRDAIQQYMDIEHTQNDTDCDLLAEAAGRACYQSFHRPNPATVYNDAYLANILKQGHESVLEHSSATFYVTGVSRSLTHELVRHRHLSYSELSQRYVDVEDVGIVYPPAFRYIDNYSEFDHAIGAARTAYRETFKKLQSQGLARKQAREAARAVMPNATETRIVVTGNMRAWRDMLKKRYHVAADAEMREFAKRVLWILRRISPNTFQDFPEEPFGS